MTAVRVARWLRPLGWGICGLALVVMVVGWWRPWTSADNSGVAAAGAQPALRTRPGLDLYPPDKRSPAPKLEGTTLDGKPFALADLAGKIVVINVWASWCSPCQVETPDLVRVSNENANRGVRFVGINTRDNLSAARAFVRGFQVQYPSVRDDSGEVLLGFQDTIPTTVIPTTVVIDRHGKVAARVIGPVTYNILEGILDDEIALSKANR